MAAALHEAGVRRVGGRLRTDGPLLFDWRPDAEGRSFYPYNSEKSLFRYVFDRSLRL
jgi:hypothetical protein